MPVSLAAHAGALDDVRALRTKNGRREQGRFSVDGAVMLGEALAAGREPLAIYVTELGAKALEARAPALAARAFLVSDKTMARLSDLETPPGLLAVHTVRMTPLGELLAADEPVLVLAEIADPGNAGTMVRAAEIFGIERVVFATSGVEAHNPKVVRATMGAVFRARLAEATAEDVLSAARAHGYEIVAATSDGEPLPGFDFPARTMLAIGNERRGVSSWLPSYDRAVTIPQLGAGESLNAAIAGGILCYAFSQHRRGTMGSSKS